MNEKPIMPSTRRTFLLRIAGAGAGLVVAPVARIVSATAEEIQQVKDQTLPCATLFDSSMVRSVTFAYNQQVQEKTFKRPRFSKDGRGGSIGIVLQFEDPALCAEFYNRAIGQIELQEKLRAQHYREHGCIVE